MSLRQAAQQALEALVEINKLSLGEHAICLPGEIDTAIDALRAALAEPEQEAISLNNGRLTQYPDGSIGVGTPAEPDSDYERGFVDGMNLQTKRSVDKAVNRIAEPRPIQECYGDCPTNPKTCPNPCNFEGRPKPEQKPQTTHWEGCEAVHPECKEKNT